jgi:hypothetical protein
MSGKPVVLYKSSIDDNGVTFINETNCSVANQFPVVNAFSPFTYSADWFSIDRGTDTGAQCDFTLLADVLSAFDSVGVIVEGKDTDPPSPFSPETIRLRVYHDATLSGTFALIATKTLTSRVNLVKFTERVGTGQIWLRFDQINPVVSSDVVSLSFPVIMVGKQTEFERCIMRRYAPLDYNRATEYLTNESGRGSFMGRSIIRRNHESSVSFDMMTGPWVRSTFQPFVRHARTKPYFFAWNPTTYPNEVNYVWTDEDIGVEYTGDRNRMSASWKMRGLGNDPQ